MARLLIVVVLLIGVYGCVALPTPIPDGGSEAANLYRNRCGSCHALAHPKRFTSRQWQSWLPQMQQIMAELGVPPLSEEENGIIEKYLKENSR